MSIFSNPLTDNGVVKKIGIAGFTGFAKVRESTNYKAVAPTHYLEDGTNASDDIRNEPIRITITGVVGDLFSSEQPTTSSILGVDVSEVGAVTALLPDRTQAQLQQIEQINFRANQVIEQANRVNRAAGDLYSFVTGASDTTAQGLQEAFINHIESIYFNKQLVDIEIENRTYSNMQISFTLTRDNQTNQYNFTINAMQVNFAELTFVDVQSAYASPSDAVSSKVATSTDKGVQNPSDTAKANPTNNTKSVLTSLFGS